MSTGAKVSTGTGKAGTNFGSTDLPPIDAPTPNSTPISPPNPARMIASTRNWVRMTRRRAPMALRMPISLVRSVTETSMMLATPIRRRSARSPPRRR